MNYIHKCLMEWMVIFIFIHCALYVLFSLVGNDLILFMKLWNLKGWTTGNFLVIFLILCLVLDFTNWNNNFFFFLFKWHFYENFSYFYCVCFGFFFILCFTHKLTIKMFCVTFLYLLKWSDNLTINTIVLCQCKRLT